MEPFENIDLPFEFETEEDSHYKSIESALCDGYTLAEYTGEYCAGLSLVGLALKDFPDNPELLAFMVIYTCKEFEKDPDFTDMGKLKDYYYDKLLDTPKEKYTARVYVAALYYLLLYVDDCEDICNSILSELEEKYPFDTLVYYAKKAIDLVCIGELPSQDEQDLFVKKLRVTRDTCVTMDRYSDYETLLLPLLEILSFWNESCCDE